MTSTSRSIAPCLAGGTLAILTAALVGCGNLATPQSDSSSATDTVTFNRDVAPILFRHCSSCHRPGEAGPFNLLTYEDAKKRAEQMVYVTEQRIMPPWLPEEACEEYVGQRRMTEKQLRTIAQWVEQGTVEGSGADLPEVPRWTEGWQQGEPDLVMELPEPYELSTDGLDVFHTYVLPIPVATTRYVKAVEVRPDNRRVVHHALLMIDRTGSLRPLDQKHSGPGFPGTEQGKAVWPEGHMPGWLPGRQAFRGRDDIAWRLEPGADAVLQLHMVPSGKPETVQVRIGFYWADAVPEREAVLLQLTRQDIDIPPGEKNYLVRDDFVLPVDVEVLAVQPHAHYLGTTMRGIARLPDGTEKSLLHIKQWDFNWQDGYEYVKPVFLPKGTTIAMRYLYDNSAENVRNPHQPPRRVTTGWKTTDEMGEFYLQVLPQVPGDFALLMEVRRLDAQRDRHAEEVERLRRAYRKSPNDGATRRQLAEAHNNLGLDLQALGRPQEALPHYQQALRIKPDFNEAQIRLASVLSDLGRFKEALSHYKDALRHDPEHVEALNNLAWLLATCPLAELRDGQRAVELAGRLAKSEGSGNFVILDTLAAAHADVGQFDHAVQWQQQAVSLAPDAQRDVLRARLELYKQGKPFREPPYEKPDE